ncbi:MAG: glycosyltransferase [Pseudomonadota bacterium]
MTKTKAYILDPALRRPAGHHLNAAMTLRQIWPRETRLLGARRARREVVSAANAERVFRVCAYDRRTYDAREFKALVDITFSDLLAAVRPSRFEPDVILLPTCDEVLAKALARFLERVRPRRTPIIAAWAILPPGHMAQDEPDAAQCQAQDIRDGFRHLHHLAGDRLRLFCETGALARTYAEITGLAFALVPCPSGTTRKTPSVVSETLTFAMLGHVNPGKGFGLLEDAISATHGMPIDFVVHLAGARETAEGRAMIKRLKSAGRVVTVLTEDLSANDYAALVSRADVIMLPYDPVIYAKKGSGIFNEAGRLGIPVIVTAGCSFAEDAIQQGAAVVMERWDGEALAAAIAQAYRSIDHHRAAAMRRSQRLTGDVSALFEEANRQRSDQPEDRSGLRLFMNDLHHFTAMGGYVARRLRRRLERRLAKS